MCFTNQVAPRDKRYSHSFPAGFSMMTVGEAPGMSRARRVNSTIAHTRVLAAIVLGRASGDPAGWAALRRSEEPICLGGHNRITTRVYVSLIKLAPKSKIAKRWSFAKKIRAGFEMRF